MVHGDVEKALHLLGVQIHREHAAHSRRMQKVRHQFRRNRHPRLIFAVLSGIPEKWDHRRNAIGARPARRVHHDEQFHQVLIGGRGGRLDDENVPAADVLLDLDVGFPVWKRADGRLPERCPDAIADALGELPVGGAAEDLHLGLESKHNDEGPVT
jgi:hypothetical protein